ncbi:TonB family protein [Orbaceae bacterium ESL0721]|nr:TonB family protein [Orbaceae bacterium ESL0721]
MNINNSKIDERKKSKSTTTYHTVKYGALSVAAHLLFVALLFSGLLFATDKVIDVGDQSIKAIMVDLSQIAAPQQSMAAKTELAKKSETDNEDQPKEPDPKAQDEKVPEEPIEEIIEPQEMPEAVTKESMKPINKQRYKQKRFNKQHKKMARHTRSETDQGESTTSQLNQEVASDNLAAVSTAPSISDNINYSQNATPISRNQPEYPRRALDMQIEGYVVVKYDVNREGRVENIRFIESKPNNVFNRSVITAMRSWRYRPVAAKDLTTRIVFNRNRSVTLSSS